MNETSDFLPYPIQREQADGELNRQKTYLDELFELAPDAIVLTTLRNPRILRINREFTRIFGYTSEEAVGNSLRNLVMLDGLEPILPEDPDLLAGRKVEWEVLRRRKDGTRFHAHITGKRIQLGDDEDAAYLIFRDISARKQADALFAGEKRLLEVIAAGGPLTSTLDALCRHAEDVDRSSFTSILLLDRKGKQLHHGAGPSLPPNYVAAIDGAPVGLGIGPCAAAAHLGEQVISLDMAADDRWSPEMRALTLAHGLRACWSTPIKSSAGRVLGTFAIYPSQPASPSPEQTSRIEQLTHLASIAIERAQSINALRQSEERYARAMGAAGDGHIEWIVATDEFYASPHFLEMCGFAADMTFRNRADFFAQFPLHPEDRDRVINAISSTLASKTDRLELEMRIVRQSETRWHHLTGLCSRDGNGELLRWNAAITDVTAAKIAERALLESEKRYERAMLAAKAGFWDWDVLKDEFYVSPHLLEMGGFPPNTAFAGREDFMRRVPLYPEDRDKWQQGVKELFERGGSRLAMDLRSIRDGETIWIRLDGMCFRDEAGRVVRWTGSSTDVTERARAEEELRSRQEMLDLAQKAAHAVAFEWRVGGGNGENRWSPDLEAMYGIPAGSYDGSYESWKKLIHPEDWPSVREAIKAAQQTGDVDAEYRVLHADGAIRWLQAKGRMLFDSEGSPTRIVGFMLDVTDRHVATQELQHLEGQLRQAQRLEALGTLAGGIAHDFNNLLGAILGYGEMALRNVRAGSRQRRDIENIMIAGERGHALVERILAFSRSGVGERVAVHVEGVVRETLALFAAKLPRHIVIEPRLQAGTAAVMGDPTQIHQVLMNLLTNAVQAMPSGGTLGVSIDRIHLQVSRVVTTGSIAAREYIALEVSDTGSGIPAGIFEKIFDPFFSTKEIGVGTGLGLSLVHGIVIGLGGGIDVATTVGQGSVFKVYLPLTGDAAAPSKPRKRLERKAARTGRGRVMVIDDEEALVRLASETLTESGYSAVGFASSAKAIAAFLADPDQFDAVITDESMPGASGSELIRKMRALRPTMPILLVSGYLSAAVIERAREAGASEVLKKPLSARQLQMAIEQVLPPSGGASTNELASSEASRRAGKLRRRASPSQSGPTRR